MNSKYLKWIIGVFGTIILGAIGSGLWDLVLKSLWFSMSKFFLEIISSIFSSFKSATYKDISKGFHEGSSIATLVVSTTILSWVFGEKCGEMVGSISNINEKCANDGSELKSALQEKLPLNTKKIEDLENQLVEAQITLQKLMRYKKYIAYFGSLFSLFAISFFLFLMMQTTYVNSAITHFDQLLKIDAPFISEKEMIQIRSAFAQISSSEDYKEIILRLENIGKENNQKIPTFVQW